MNIQAAPDGQRPAARHDGTDGAGLPAHEIKYHQDAAGYVAAMLAELRQIAGKAGLDRLVRSLDAAYYEAYGALDSQARPAAPVPRNGTPATPAEKTSKSVEPNGG